MPSAQRLGRVRKLTSPRPAPALTLAGVERIQLMILNGHTQRTTPTQTYSLLVIEDHPVMRRLLQEMLEGEPELHVMDALDSAEKALECLTGPNKLSPDLLLVDLSLPGMSGIGLVTQLKQERPELRCLVVTGHTDPIYRSAAEGAGAARFVTKDDPDEILGAVYKILKG